MFHLSRGGALALHHHALAQRFQRLWGGNAFDLHKIGFGQFVAWMGQAMVHQAIIREEQQALAIHVQPPGRVDPLRHIHELAQGGTSLRIGKGGEHAIRLMKEEITKGFTGPTGMAEGATHPCHP